MKLMLRSFCFRCSRSLFLGKFKSCSLMVVISAALAFLLQFCIIPPLPLTPSSCQALLTDMLLTLLVVEFISYLFFPGALCGFVIYAVNFVPSLRLLWSSSPSLWLLVSDWSSSGSVGAVDVAYSAVWLFCREFSIVRTF